ncbi:MAG: tetratricopeptide repeat protein [Promethearchaeota archaeon]|nr:MAG: tetratricopeptide repeat protein [Candidatus Lokiarchaeota archaeon]
MILITESKQINVPPKEIINEKNFEHIILWMLSNNDYCGWSDFTQEFEKDNQLISESTLSIYLNRLKRKNLIDKPERDHYIILPEGKKRFLELSKLKKKKKSLNYPPDLIKKERNFDHWILWMLYNNNACRWSDFTDDPVNINQSTLSKNLNLLMDSGFVRKENKMYKITQSGKIEYSKLLKMYDLDRQAILEEESKKIEDITKKTNQFFNKYGIQEDDIKFRFLNNILKLNYTKVKNLLNERDDFNKIILFLSINHPDFYPEYMTTEYFSYEFDIKKTTLDFFIDKIVEEEYFGIKFFKFKKAKDQVYYFRVNEKLERSLKTIVDYHITRFTYLNKLYENRDKKTFNFTITNIIEQILKESSGILVHEDLNDALRNFLPNYIKYLAYKIEAETQLTTDESKLESLIWQSLSESFQGFEGRASKIYNGNDEFSYDVDHHLFETFDIFYLTKLSYINHSDFYELEEIENIQYFSKLLEFLRNKNIKQALRYLEKNSGNLNNLEYKISEDIINTCNGNFEESLKITEDIIEKYHSMYLGYLMQSLTYFLMGRYDSALEVIDKYYKGAINLSLKSQKIQILLKIDEEEKALKLLEEFSNLKNSEDITLILNILHTIIDQKCVDENCEDILDMIENFIDKKPMNEKFMTYKAIILTMIAKYKEVKKLIDDNIDFNPLHKKPLIHLSAYLALIYSYIAEGNFKKVLEIADFVLVLYPNHPKAYLLKSVVIGYNLIYNSQGKEITLDNFQSIIQKAISLEQIRSNKAIYLQFKSLILNEITEFEKALKTIDEAIELFPERDSLFMKKVYIMIRNGMEKKALELLDDLIIKFPSKKKKYYQWKSFIYFKIKDFEKGLDIIEKASEIWPEDKKILNNKAILSAKLNKKEQAFESIEKLTSLYPNDGNLYDSYGEILMELGDYEDAIQKFKKAIKIEPNGWFVFETYKKMAVCYQKLGNDEEATKSFKKYEDIKEKIFPSDRELYEHGA